MWQKHLEQTLRKLGFKKLINDECIYTLSNEKGSTIIAVHVDDILQTSTSIALVKLLHDGLVEAYSGVTYHEKASSFCGMTIESSTDRHTIKLSQTGLTKTLISKSIDDNATSASSPGGSDLMNDTTDTPRC
jgi:hypothetical protein